MSAAKLTITLENISHCYGGILSLDQISYQFATGSLTAVFGPNGGGKSTLLKIIAGILKPTSGTIRSHIKYISDLAYLAQGKDIDRTFPIHVEDVVAMGLWPKIGVFRGLGRDDLPLVDDALAQVGLVGFNKRCLTELSGGQLQRLFFARLIAQQANFILLDEPFTGIDANTTKDLLGLIQRWHQQGKTIIAVLHDMTIIQQFFPTCLLISRKLVAAGASDDVLTIENLAKAAFNV
ncbi:metal ABC transporter ATP-binding protein [Candidatus Paracaedibacter symbiosus]|uniref:metal ABC transporter ATP-binding protein n=1 Tax=Candidatus Paracaedibacter symbiosus TaxID=244582 RepID=UPI00068CB647|nr:ABC transporter ATP-binding protein [Candidatus Paracaedibacter symbiosus]